MNIINKSNLYGGGITSLVGWQIIKLSTIALVVKILVAPLVYCLATVFFLLKP